MFEQKRLIFWLLVSSALHISILVLTPKSDLLVPPRPIYLVVDLIARSGRELSNSGSPQKGRETEKKQGPPEATDTRQPKPRASAAPPQAVVPAPPISKKPVEKAPEKITAQTEKAQISKEKPEPAVTKQPIEKPTSAEPSPAAKPGETPPQAKGNSGGDTEAEAANLQGKSGSMHGSPGGATGSAASTVTTPLAYGTNPPPPYPLSARHRGWEGEVLLLIDVSAEGRVRKVSVEKSSGFSILDEAAQKAVYQWRFNPARQNGRPVPGQVKVPIRFDLTIAG